ncbi:MAG: hypothetical protein V1719_01610 [Patescibacteria group bacterium]
MHKQFFTLALAKLHQFELEETANDDFMFLTYALGTALVNNNNPPPLNMVIELANTYDAVAKKCVTDETEDTVNKVKKQLDRARFCRKVAIGG